MTTTRDTSDFERAAAGQDFDHTIRDRASSLGSSLAEHGPEALFEEIENLLPEAWREHIQSFPITAVVIGFGVGLFLGMKKGDELLAAGTSMISAAAMANITHVLDKSGGVG